MNLNGLLRGDQAARYEAYQIALQNKILTRDEVRALEDLVPFGDDRGGLLETPNNNNSDPRIEAIAALVRSGYEPIAAMKLLGVGPIPHLGLPPVTVQPPRDSSPNKENPNA